MKNLIFLFGFSAFVTMAWIGLTVYHNTTESQITPANRIKIEPIEPQFDMETINQLDSRQEIRANLNEQAEIIGEDSELISASESSTIEQEQIIETGSESATLQ